MHVGDTIFIFCLALIIFGPKKLPEIGRQIGKLMVEFRRASNEFKMQIDEELRASDESERQKEITAAAAIPPSAASGSPMLSASSGTDSSATPVIAPPSTGLPVNHTFPSTDSVIPAGEVAVVSQDAYPEPADGFNAGLNTASNGLVAETPAATPSAASLAFAEEAVELINPAAQQIEAEKAQAHAHHD